ncbi:SIMPL domain-containing protein [Flavobacterium sp.]|uniref:SIMPL domain-containing protein n=1 Tax=Flavobacterium sp. TaxID=239 RepID=UPI003342AE6A
MNAKIPLLIAMHVLSNSLFAQISGNQIYKDKNNTYHRNENTTIINTSPNITMNDSMLFITTKVLLNQKADQFLITLGVNEESKSSISCDNQINNRISDLISKLKYFGIKKEAISVDFISQSKIYDNQFIRDTIKEYEKGFEIKKNIIIATNRLENIDLIIKTAAEFKIYDIVKVDYLNDDLTAIHDEIFDEALKICRSKKDKYLRAFNRTETGQVNMSEQFYFVFPETQYNEYKAFETTEFETNYNNYTARVIKKERKNTTYYYNGIDCRGFDKVIHAAETEVGVQYILTINISVKLANQNKK